MQKRNLISALALTAVLGITFSFTCFAMEEEGGPAEPESPPTSLGIQLPDRAETADFLVRFPRAEFHNKKGTVLNIDDRECRVIKATEDFFESLPTESSKRSALMEEINRSGVLTIISSDTPNAVEKAKDLARHGLRNISLDASISNLSTLTTDIDRLLNVSTGGRFRVSVQVTDMTDVLYLTTLLSQNKTTLESLDLRFPLFDQIDKDFTSFATALSRNTTLRSLIFNKNRGGDDLAVALANALKKNKTLRHLSIVRSTQNLMGPKGAEALADMLRENKGLEELRITISKIGNEGTTQIARALQSNTTLTSLELRACKIDSEGVKTLAENLRENRTLRSLSLQGNNIGIDGAQSVVDILKKAGGLEELNVVSTHIDPEGVGILANTLSTNATLRRLSIANNIGDKGAEALANALRINHTLEVLDLRDSVLDQGPANIIDALSSNNTLRVLNLSGVSLYDNDMEAVVRMLQANRTLIDLNISRGHASTPILKALGEVIKVHPSLRAIEMGQALSNNPKEVAEVLMNYIPPHS